MRHSEWRRTSTSSPSPNVAHDHRDVDVAGGTFERVDVEHAERRRQRDANRFTAVRRDGDHLGEHAAAVYPDADPGKLTRMGDGRSLWFVQPRSVEVRSEPLTSARDGQVLVRTVVLRHQRRHRDARLSRGARSRAAGRRDDRRARRHVPVPVPVRLQLRRRRRGEPCRPRARGRSSSPSTRIRTASSPTPADVVPLGSADPRRATLFPLVETALQITLDAGPVFGETGRRVRPRRRRHADRVAAAARRRPGDRGRHPAVAARRGGRTRHRRGRRRSCCRRTRIGRASCRGAARDRSVRQPGRAAHRARTAVARGHGARRVVVRHEGRVAAARRRVPPPPPDDPQHAGVDDPGASERSMDRRATPRRRRRAARRTPARPRWRPTRSRSTGRATPTPRSTQASTD